MTFTDREHAGLLLAHALKAHIRPNEKVVVFGLPRGGVVVAAEVAKALKAPLDVIIVKKLGHPDNPEFAVGAVGENDLFLNNQVDIDAEYIKKRAEELRKQIKQLATKFRGKKPFPDLEGKTAILVDDGIATGLTTKVAIAELKLHGPERIILAVPVAAPDALANLSGEVDELVCLYAPAFFMAVGQFYNAFEQVDDKAVSALLKPAHG